MQRVSPTMNNYKSFMVSAFFSNNLLSYEDLYFDADYVSDTLLRRVLRISRQLFVTDDFYQALHTRALSGGRVKREPQFIHGLVSPFTTGESCRTSTTV